MRGVLMKLPSPLPSSCFFLIVFVWTTAAASSSSLNLLGVAPRDVGYYKSGSLLWCKDRSNRFSIDRLNDDFCDCPDGTDEPGTSACTNGRFYCSNPNRMPFWVFSSRVNDGICDCCDGSDEYDGKVRCGHVCSEDGNMPQEVSLSKPLKEFPVRDKMRSTLGEQAENEPPSTMVKSYSLKMLGVLELLLVLIALWQVYRWTFQRGFGLKKRLHRSL